MSLFGDSDLAFLASAIDLDPVLSSSGPNLSFVSPLLGLELLLPALAVVSLAGGSSFLSW
jgi:hypothetical protein